MEGDAVQWRKGEEADGEGGVAFFGEVKVLAVGLVACFS